MQVCLKPRWILIFTIFGEAALAYYTTPSAGLKRLVSICRNNIVTEFTVPDLDNQLNFSICYSASDSDGIDVSIKQRGTANNESENKVSYRLRKRKNLSFFLDVTFSNVTSSELGLWRIKVTKLDTTHEQDILISNADMPSSIEFTKSEKSDLNEKSVSVKCTANNFPKRIEIIDRCDGTVYTKKSFNRMNYQRVLTETFEFLKANANPKLLLALECKVYNYQNKSSSVFLDLKGNNVPSTICSIHVVKVNVNDTARVGIKLLAYPKILTVNVIKNSRPDVVENKWTSYLKSLSEVLWYIELTKDNIQEEDLGNYSVSLESRSEPASKLNFSMMLSLKDEPKFQKIQITDTCEGVNSSTTVYRLVKSGLPLSFPESVSELYDYDVIPNPVSSEYLIKLKVNNCTERQFYLHAGSTQLSSSFQWKKTSITLEECDAHNYNTTVFVQIGNSVDFVICVVSQSLIAKNGIGWNNIPFENITNNQKYTVNISNAESLYKIKITIRNITRDDIKFYLVTVRNKQLAKRLIILNLLLKEGSPYFCDALQTVTTYYDVNENSTVMNFCIRSYPVLSRHILINNKLYRINGTFDGLNIDSTVNEQTFSNFITITIQTKGNRVTKYKVTVFNVKNDSFTFDFNITEQFEETTTTSTASTWSSSEITTTEGLLIDIPKNNTSKNEEKNCNQIIAISISVVALLVCLAFALFIFLWINRKRAHKRRSRASVKLKYLKQPVYNNMQEIKALNVDKEDKLTLYESKYENIVKNTTPDINSNVDKSQTGMLPGRYRNDKGLIYVTIDFQNKDPKTAAAKNTEGNYVQIDPIKTKQMLQKHLK